MGVGGVEKLYVRDATLVGVEGVVIRRAVAGAVQRATATLGARARARARARGDFRSGGRAAGGAGKAKAARFHWSGGSKRQAGTVFG